MQIVKVTQHKISCSTFFMTEEDAFKSLLSIPGPMKVDKIDRWIVSLITSRGHITVSARTVFNYEVDLNL